MITYNKVMNIAFVPIDNRPVCYTLPKQIADINDSINLYMPERDWLGDLTKYADTEKLFEWLEDLKDIDAVILPLDTVAYGGLISSRRCPDSFEKIKERIYKLREILEKKNAKIYAFSSIMRISNNNVNEEEKEYWNKWGKKIFEYSYNLHKFGAENCKHSDIPEEILSDYLATRKRNFEINKIYLEWQKGSTINACKNGLFDTLIFSKDDCAEYGLNVIEANELKTLGGFVKTGADEIPLTLLARAVSDAFAGGISAEKSRLKVAPVFLEPEYKNLISNYEDVSIENSVKGQLELAGCELCEPCDADILLYVNNFKERQGEIVMKVSTDVYNGNWKRPDKPYMIADVRFANGADNAFVNKLFEAGLGDNFYGYSAWNTSANSLGSLICAAVVKFYSNCSTLNSSTARNFKNLQIIRFLDDWAYQANVRQELSKPDIDEVSIKMKPYEAKVFSLLDTQAKVSYNFPWNRLFEIEVNLN